MKTVQKSLFPEYNDEVLNEKQTFHIRHERDFDFDVPFHLNEGQEAERVALEQLGYFIISE